MTSQEYQAAVEWLFVQAPNYQIDGKRAYKPGLDNIKKLCAHFGNPQDKIKTVHIGGTNGKGSTSNMLASVLQEAGYKIGLYNSPHLIDFTERIKVNGENANREFVFGFVQKLKTLPHDIRPSFFEFTTIMAFEYFYQQKVDIAIIEVGLGGRLDSTNIITRLPRVGGQQPGEHGSDGRSQLREARQRAYGVHAQRHGEHGVALGGGTLQGDDAHVLQA